MTEAILDFELVHPADDAAPFRWLNIPVGGAQFGLPEDSSGFNGYGIDQVKKPMQISNGPNDLVEDEYYSIWSDELPVAYDMSQTGQAMFMHIRNNSSTYTAIGFNPDSLWFIVFSGGGTTEYARWHRPGDPGVKGGEWEMATMHGTPDFQTVGYVNTNITSVGFAIQSKADGHGYGFQMALDQVVYCNVRARFGDTGVPYTASLIKYYDLLKPKSGTDIHSMAVVKAGTTIEFAFSISIEAHTYEDSDVAIGIAHKEADGVLATDPPLGFFSDQIISQPGGSIKLSNAVLATNSTPCNLLVDATNGTIEMASCFMVGVNDSEFKGAGLTMSGCTITSPATISIGEGLIDMVINSPQTAVNMDFDLLPGSRVGINAPILDALSVNVDVGDYSHIEFNISDGSIVNVSPTTGALEYDLSGMNSPGTLTFDNDLLTTVNTTIVLSPTDLVAVLESPLSGSGLITLDNTVNYTMNISGLPHPCIVAVYDDDSADPQELGTELLRDNSTSADLEYTFPSSKLPDNVEIRVFKAGFKQFSESVELQSGDFDFPVKLIQETN